MVTLPARSVMVAAGTSPNVIYEKEHPGTFKLDKYGQFFQSFATSDAELIEVDGNTETGFFTSYQRGTKRITFYGDNHPRYAGNVVKAMASAKDGYPHVVALFDGQLGAARVQTRRQAGLVVPTQIAPGTQSLAKTHGWPIGTLPEL